MALLPLTHFLPNAFKKPCTSSSNILCYLSSTSSLSKHHFLVILLRLLVLYGVPSKRKSGLHEHPISEVSTCTPQEAFLEFSSVINNGLLLQARPKPGPPRLNHLLHTITNNQLNFIQEGLLPPLGMYTQPMYNTDLPLSPPTFIHTLSVVG